MKQHRNFNKIGELITFYEDMTKLMKNFYDIIKEKCKNIQNINAILDFLSVSKNFLINNNLFVYISKEELNLIISIFENSCNYLVKSQEYLCSLQTFIPGRIDNSSISLPVHRLIGPVKIKYW